MDDPLLSQEQIDLLQWLGKQPEPLSLLQLSKSDAPGYTQNRLIGLQEREQLIDRTFIVNAGGLVGQYGINDRGRAVLSKLEQERRQEAEEKKRRDLEQQRAEIQNNLARSQNRIMAIQTVITLASFIAGLLAEHYGRILDWLFNLFL